MMRLLLRDDKDAILVPIPQYPLYSVSLSEFSLCQTNAPKSLCVLPLCMKRIALRVASCIHAVESAAVLSPVSGGLWEVQSLGWISGFRVQV